MSRRAKVPTLVGATLVSWNSDLSLALSVLVLSVLSSRPLVLRSSLIILLCEVVLTRFLIGLLPGLTVPQWQSGTGASFRAGLRKLSKYLESLLVTVGWFVN